MNKLKQNPKRFRLETKSSSISSSGRKVSSAIDEYTYTDENDDNDLGGQDEDDDDDDDDDEDDNDNTFQPNDFDDEQVESSPENDDQYNGGNEDDEDDMSFYRRRPAHNVLEDDDSNQDGVSMGMSVVDVEHGQHGLIKRRQCNGRVKDDWKDSGEDTNERYCICKDVSYGEMVMCDNPKVCRSHFFSIFKLV